MTPLPARHLVVCTIEPHYAQLIGACMQFLSLQHAKPIPNYLLRIVDGEKAENRPFAAFAAAAGMPWRPVKGHPENRFLNKWLELQDLLCEVPGPVLLLDWDVLNTSEGSLPISSDSRISARLNSPASFSTLPETVCSLAPHLWDKTNLPCSINSGVVVGPASLLASAARRVLELEPLIQQAAPEATDWHREKLAASMALGEIGLHPIGEEWNVTAVSNLPDEQVRFWHFHSGHNVTRALKKALHRPAQTKLNLQALSPRWSRQHKKFLHYYEAALEKLRLEELLEPDAAERDRPRGGSEITQATRKRYLLAACSSGLCNRLLVLAGALRLATLTGRELFLYWPINHELGCSFHELFSNEFKMLQEKDVHYLLNTGVTLRIYNAWHTRTPHFSDVAPDGDPDVEIVVLKAFYYPKFRHDDYDGAFFEQVRQPLLSLNVQEAVLQSIAGFRLPHRTVGVHLRRGEKTPEFQCSKDEHFQCIMEALTSAVPDVSFFLATDCMLTEQKFRRLFGKRILRLPKEWPGRESPDGIKEGLKDLLLLSRSSALLGTNYSSFSHTASALGGIPLVTADILSSGRALADTIALLKHALDSRIIL